MNAIIDIETDNLLDKVTKIHCIAVKEFDDECEYKPKVYTSYPIDNSDGSLDDFISQLDKYDRVIFHNGIKFDIPTIKKVLNIDLYSFNFTIIDTLLVSQLAYPNMLIIDTNNSKVPPKLKGSHSLKAWGYRLGEYKGNYGEQEEAWGNLTVDMADYCKQDTEVTYKLYTKLESKGVPYKAIWLEQNFARIISRQEQYGVYFDIDKAHKLHIELMKDAEEATEKLRKVFKPLLLPKGNVKNNYKKPYPFKLGGMLIAGHHQPLQLIEFNPASRQHIAIWFKRLYDWESPEKTEKGNPVINEAVLKTLDFHEAKILTHYFNVNKLLGMIAEGDNAWLKLVDSNSRIHGQVNTIGAVSRRCTHNKPNLSQVPSSRAFKGTECRALFTVPKGKKLVGCDADGLELRTLSHYLYRYDKGEYARTVDEGNKENGTDIHTLNQKAAGLPTRDDAKTFIYALMYGAGDEKLGSILNGGSKEGKKMRGKFLKKIPAMAELLKDVQDKVKKAGYLTALDGNKYFIRSSHSALNTLLQGCGALVMKYYLIYLDFYLSNKYKQGEQFEFVLNVHDEVQIECNEDIAEDVANICEKTFGTVTKNLKFNIPLRGTASIGNNWAETH